VCDCGVSRGPAVSPTNSAATTTIPSRQSDCLVQFPRGFSQCFGQCLLLSINGGEAIVLTTPNIGTGTWWGWGPVSLLSCYIHCRLATRTVAVPMRSFQSSVHGWPFVPRGVVASFPPCEVHFVASKPPGRGCPCFGHQPGLEVLVARRHHKHAFDADEISPFRPLDKLMFKLKGSTGSSPTRSTT